MRASNIVGSVVVVGIAAYMCAAQPNAERDDGRDYKAVAYKGDPLPIDPAVQRQLRELWEGSQTASELQQQMVDILVDDKGLMGHLAHKELGRQVLFHLANTSPDTEASRRAPVFLWQLLQFARTHNMFFPNSAAIAAEPYLDADDPDLLRAVEWMLGTNDVLKPERGYRQEPVFRYVKDFFINLRDPYVPWRTPPDWLIAAIYKVDPPAAMNTYLQSAPLRRGESPPLRRAQLRVENHVALKNAGVLAMEPPAAGKTPTAAEVEPGAAEALRELAASEYWWVRLYVVATMAKHPELRDRGVLDRLAADPNNLVRAGVAAIARGHDDDDEAGPGAEEPPVADEAEGEN